MTDNQPRDIKTERETPRKDDHTDFYIKHADKKYGRITSEGMPKFYYTTRALKVET